MLRRVSSCLTLWCVCFTWFCAPNRSASAQDIYRRENLIAWCIVPFDSQKRTPAQRAQMLDSMGIRQLAYDYRAEHVPTFDDELDQLAKHHITLSAWWFPTQLNDEARLILRVLEKHKVKTQLWVTGGGAPTKSAEEQQARVESEAARIRPIAEAAAKQGCTVALYNHGSWFGEPENQIAIIEHLKLNNVGIVYNLHHGHSHVDRFPQLLKAMMPHLMAVNLNGMMPDGDQKGQKIMPIGAGSLDTKLIQQLRDSGYKGPVGILNHTDEDAEARLLDNLDGLSWIVSQLDGKPAGPRPQFRSWKAPPAAAPAAGAGAGTGAGAASNAPPYDEEAVKRLAVGGIKNGVAERGVALFASARTACLTCHKIGAIGGSVGPDLTKIGKDRTPVQLAESLLYPNKTVEDKYRVVQALTAEGRIVNGYRVSETDKELVIRDPSSGLETRLAKEDLDDIRGMPSMMPEGLAASMSPEQQQDLIAFLTELGQHRVLRSEIIQSVLEHAQPHDPAGFALTLEPLDKHSRPDWQAHVNRDRIYDFYTKEANAFRTAARFEPLLAEFPGVDGGKQGHWGNQNEATWENEDWNSTDLGSLQSGVFRTDKSVIARAACVRLGDHGELSACFDPDELRYPLVWRGGFIKFSKVRHGFINPLEADGEVVTATEAGNTIPRTNSQAKYLGLYRLGRRVVFAYRIGDTEYLDWPWVKDGQFTREVAPRSQHSLRDEIDRLGKSTAKGSSAAQWPEVITTDITLNRSGQPGYEIDSIELPWNNPWKALMYCSGHDFLTDGSALVCTMQGDVWHARGFSLAESIDRSGDVQSSLANRAAWPNHAQWRRFASGLHHSLGLKIDSDGIYVLGRDQITRLHDRDGDGEADFYECFSNAYETSPAGHDYICGLERDAAGNFYTASGNQGLVRISRDGQHADIIAVGFRNPDGLGIAPNDGLITVPCSEGDWTPASMICAVRPQAGRSVAANAKSPNLEKVPFFGHRGKQIGKLPMVKPELPLVYLPRGLDNSAGGQVAVTSRHFGPLTGQMMHFSFGTGSQFLLLRDAVGEQMQGAIVLMGGQFKSGAHRARFSAHDGQLYVSGMAGWGSYTIDRGSFERVRYTGAPVQMPIGFHLHENGIVITFSQKLDRAFCEQAREHFAQAWNYRYSSAYGSAEYSALHYGMRGHDQLRVASAHVLADERSLFLELPALQLCNQLHIQVATGAQERHDLLATCNALDAPLEGIDGVEASRKKLPPHPLETDMAMISRRVPNPWRQKIASARAISIEAGKNLSYSTRELHSKAGEPIALTLRNPDVVPHNWALIQPGSLSRVGNEANRLVADPEAVIRQYVPQTSDVICYTDIVDPSEETTVYFRAPSQPGRYPFLCTFPGHWMVMNGELIVNP